MHSESDRGSKLRPGRELEILVSRLEDWLGPTGAEIKSPDRIPDKHKGNAREVDVSIRTRIGSSSILVVLECRDEKDPQDVTWIEQLATKRHSIGADKIIAVSSSGFTRGAETKAHVLGVEIRRVTDITKEDAASWARLTKISLTYLHWDVIELRIECRDSGPETPEFEPSMQQLLTDRTTATDTQFGREVGSGRALSIRALLGHIRATQEDVLSDILPGNPRVRKTFTVCFSPGTFCVFGVGGDLELKRIEMKLDLWMTNHAAPPARVYDYANMDGSVIQIAQTEIPVAPGRTITAIYSTSKPADFEVRGSAAPRLPQA